MNWTGDDNLKKFLQENQPQAPAAPRDELSVLMKRLGYETPKSSRVTRTPWFAFGGIGAVAASLAVVWMTGQAPVTESPDRSDEWALSLMTTEDEDDILPTTDVGEDYLGLIAGR